MAIVGATVFDGAGRRIDNGVVVIADGKVAAIGGADTPVPAGYEWSTRGRFGTPGVIDVHSIWASIPRPACRA